MASPALLAAGHPSQDRKLPDKLEVLAHQRHINLKLGQLLQAVRNGDKAGAEKHTLEFRRSFARDERYLGGTIQPKYYGQYHPHDTQVAAKVFAIPELLGSILESVQVIDLMRCYGVNRSLRDTIENSKELQKCLFLQPDPDHRKASSPLEKKYIEPFGTRKSRHPNPSRADLYTWISLEENARETAANLLHALPRYVLFGVPIGELYGAQRHGNHGDLDFGGWVDAG